MLRNTVKVPEPQSKRGQHKNKPKQDGLTTNLHTCTGMSLEMALALEYLSIFALCFILSASSISLRPKKSSEEMPL